MTIDDLARGRNVTPVDVDPPKRSRALTRLIKRLDELDDETARHAAKLLTVFLNALESNSLEK